MKPSSPSVDHLRLPRNSSLVCLFSFVVSRALFVGILALTNHPAHAAAPLAGSTIGNQASATYTDASSTPRTATSNVTLTVIQQVASLTLTSDQSKSVAPGGQAVFPHTLNNTGNGADTFSLSVANLAGDNFDLTNAAIYADANADGLPDNSTAITSTGLLAVGAKFQFVVVGTVPSSQTSGQRHRHRRRQRCRPSHPIRQRHQRCVSERALHLYAHVHQHR